MDCKQSRTGLGMLAAYALVLVGIALPAGAQTSPRPSRMVSINLCTDQLLLALATPSQIAGVSRLARTELSYLAPRAGGIRAMSGGAEDVLALKPDLVLAGAFSGAETRALLARYGLQVETFATVTTMSAARDEITRAASLFGNPIGGHALLAEVDRALAAARGVGRGLTAIAYERRGFAAGRGTLIDELMDHLGLANAATRAGLSSVGAMPLEAIVKIRPDLLILDWEGATPPDQGTALLRHPVLARTIPPSRQVVLPAALISCAGPALPAAIDKLAALVARIPGKGL